MASDFEEGVTVLWDDETGSRQSDQEIAQGIYQERREESELDGFRVVDRPVALPERIVARIRARMGLVAERLKGGCQDCTFGEHPLGLLFAKVRGEPPSTPQEAQVTRALLPLEVALIRWVQGTIYTPITMSSSDVRSSARAAR